MTSHWYECSHKATGKEDERKISGEEGEETTFYWTYGYLECSLIAPAMKINQGLLCTSYLQSLDV